MSHQTTRRGLLAGGAVAALSALAGCTSTTPLVGQRIEETETVGIDEADSLAVETSTGSVTVRTGDRDDIQIDITKQSSAVTADVTDLHLRTERQDSRLRLYSEWTGKESLFGGRPSMDLDITVPASLAVTNVETTTGSVDIDGTRGDLEVSGSTGSVKLRNIDGNVDATTSTGSINVVDVNGAVTASASTGSVEVRSPERLSDIDTSTGSIAVDVPALDGDTNVTASTGSVDAALSSELDAALVVSTSDGSIDTEDIDIDIGDLRDDRVTGTLGDGGPQLTIETSTGSIALKRLG